MSEAELALDDDNIECMNNSGSVVVLEATPETVRERTKDTFTRPLLKASENNDKDLDIFLPSNSLMFEKEMISRISNMMRRREESYRKAGNLFISTDNVEPKKVALRILGIND